MGKELMWKRGKGMGRKGKIEKWDVIKVKRLWRGKESRMRVKREGRKWEKILGR